MRVLVAVGAVVGVALLWILMSRVPRSNRLPLGHEAEFNASVWAACGRDDREVHRRRAMLPDLLANRIKPGMTALEIAQLLGWPDVSDKSHWYYSIEYEYDPEASRREYLELAFDTDGGLLSASVASL